MSFLVDTNLLLRSAQWDHPSRPEANNAIQRLWAVATRPLIHNGLGMSARVALDEIQ